MEAFEQEVSILQATFLLFILTKILIAVHNSLIKFNIIT